MKSILLLIGALSPAAFACKPAPDFKRPSLEKSYAKANMVFLGRILTRNGFDGDQTKYEIEMIKAFKGSFLNSKTDAYNSLSSCSKLIDDSPDSICVFFMDHDGNLIAGPLVEGSFCARKDSKEAKTLASDFEKKIAKFKSH